MDNWKPKTKLVHAGVKRSQFGELSEAMFLTQGFVYETAEQAEARFIQSAPDEYVYGRYGNPTVRMFEERMMALEGAQDAFGTATGMAAVSGALFAMLRAGDHIISSKALFGSCLFVIDDILRRWGVQVTLVDGTDLDQWQAAMKPNTKVLFLEAISNPTLEVCDIQNRPRRWCATGGRQCFRHANFSTHTGTGCGCRDLFRHQTHRRAGALFGRRRSGHIRIYPRRVHPIQQTHRSIHEPV